MLWHHKTRVPALLYDIVFVIHMFSRFVITLTPTDRRTQSHSIYRASRASRCKNTPQVILRILVGLGRVRSVVGRVRSRK